MSVECASMVPEASPVPARRPSMRRRLVLDRLPDVLDDLGRVTEAISPALIGSRSFQRTGRNLTRCCMR